MLPMAPTLGLSMQYRHRMEQYPSCQEVEDPPAKRIVRQEAPEGQCAETTVGATEGQCIEETVGATNE